MDQSWINFARISDAYERGVEEFIQFAQQNAHGERFRCPCVNCLNGRFQTVDECREHLLCDGFLKSYTTWTWHGELFDFPTVDNTDDHVEAFMDDRIENMIRDVGVDSFLKSQMYEDMSNNAEIPLYPGCTQFTRLSAVLRLVNLKAINGWTDKAFTELLQLLKEMLPEGNTLPNRNYEAKKILCPMGLEYKKIHACPNDCILYRGEFEDLKKCPKCGLSRYKVKDGEADSNNERAKDGPPVKVVWYLPIIPRIKRLFANPNDAKNLRWHAEGRKCDGKQQEDLIQSIPAESMPVSHTPHLEYQSHQEAQ